MRGQGRVAYVNREDGCSVVVVPQLAPVNVEQWRLPGVLHRHISGRAYNAGILSMSETKSLSEFPKSAYLVGHPMRGSEGRNCRFRSYYLALGPPMPPFRKSKNPRRYSKRLPRRTTVHRGLRGATSIARRVVQTAAGGTW